MSGRVESGGATPWWSRVYPAVWAALLALAVAGMAAGFWNDQRRNADIASFSELGLRLGPRQGATVLRTPLDHSGDLARIRPGDVIVAVNGQAAPRAYADLRRLGLQLAAAAHPQVRVSTQGKDGRRQELQLVRSAAHVDQAYAGSGLTRTTLNLAYYGLNTLIHLSLVAMSALLFLRARRDRVAALIGLSSLLLAAATVYGPVTYYQQMPGLELYAALRPALGTLGWLGLLCGLLVFPAGRLDPPWTRLALAAYGVFSIGALLAEYGVIDGSWVVPANAAMFGVALAAQVTRYHRLPAGPQRQQIRWVLFGLAAAMVPGSATALVEMVRVQTADFRLALWLYLALPLLFLSVTLLFLGGFAISLIKYRLYDAEAVISRSAGYAILTLGLAATWAGAEKALEVSFEAVMGHEAGAATAGVAAGLAALLVTPAHHRVMHWTERVFQKGLSDLRRVLPAQLADLRDTAGVGELAEVALARVEPALRAASAAVVVRGGPAWRLAGRRDVEAAVVQAWIRANRDALQGEATAHDRADPQFPLRLALEIRPGAAPTGWLLLGPRPDGSFYGRDELEALAEIARPLARALQVAQAREAREAALRRELDRLRADLAELRRGLRPAAE